MKAQTSRFSIMLLVWIVAAAAAGAQTFTLTGLTNVTAGEIWCGVVFDGSNLVVSTESNGCVLVVKFTTDLVPAGAPVLVASSNDTAGAGRIADHKHLFQNGHHYIAFSTAGTGVGGYLYLLKLDAVLNRVGIVNVASNDPPTNDPLIVGDGTNVYVGKFLPGTGHRIYGFDANLSPILTTEIGGGSNAHINCAAMLYDANMGRFHLAAPTMLVNGDYVRIVFDHDWNVVASRKTILEGPTNAPVGGMSSNDLGLLTGLVRDPITGRFVIFYDRGTNDAGGDLCRAIYSTSWALLTNEVMLAGRSLRPHAVVVGTNLFVGCDGEGVRLLRYSIEPAPRVTACPIVDFDGDLSSDLAVYVESTGAWYARTLDDRTNAWGVVWGGPGLMPVLGSFGGGYASEYAAYDESHGAWFVSATNGMTLAWGTTWGGFGMIPVPGDYNGDGQDDWAVYDTATGRWYVSDVGGNVLLWAQVWGGPSLIPVPGDYDGDGAADLAVYDQASGRWYVRTLPGVALVWATAWGGATLTPVPGDYNGNGTTDLAVYGEASGQWFVRGIDGTLIAWADTWGGPGLKAVSGDYDGDGVFDLTVYDSRTGYWYIRRLDGAVLAFPLTWGGAGLEPVNAMFTRATMPSGYTPSGGGTDGGSGPWDGNLLLRIGANGNSFGAASVMVSNAGVPSITRMADNRLLSAFQWFPGSPTASWDKVAVSFSSDEGATWSAPETVRITDFPSTYQRPFDPTVVRTEDGRIRMYFTTTTNLVLSSNTLTRIGSAVSTNGVDYSYEPGIRFQVTGTGIVDSAAIKLGNRWHISVPGHDPPLGHAYHGVSDDGLTFTQTTDITSSGNENWTGNFCAVESAVRFYGNHSQNGLWWASTSDGTNWSTPTYLGIHGGDPAPFEVSSNRFLLIYVGLQ